MLIRLEGDWVLGNEIPSIGAFGEEIAAGEGIESVSFDTAGIGTWDTGLLIFLDKAINLYSRVNIPVDKKGLPKGAQHLLSLAAAVPVKKEAGKKPGRAPFLDRLGTRVLAYLQSLLDAAAFVGEVFVAFMQLLRGKARFRGSDLLIFMQQSGAQALPIVSLVSVLVGMILAFIGAIQLRLFGAQIYVTSLVGIGMARALAAVMTAIIMSGRTGASFAAQIGTMQVNEEIDALKTLGISPVEFLVLPRMIALSLMLPLLSIYADLLGILGGLIVGVTLLDLDLLEYYARTREAVSINDFWVGVFSASVFGILVALSGCLRGMRSGKSASAVGEATTSAVVTAIVSIVVATAVITAICHVLNI